MTDHPLTPAPPGLARRLASRAVTAALILSVVSVPASLVFVCGAVRTETGLVVLALFTLPPLILMLGRALSRLIRDRLLRRDLRRQLAARIQRAGLADADPRDPQRAELERAFWRESQARALVELRQRFAYDPEPLDIFRAISDSVLDSKTALISCASLSALLTLGGGALAWHAGEPILSAMAIGFGSAAGILFTALLLLAAESLAAQRQSLTAHQTFVAERRRIATMAELAGGLSLAEHEIDDALRGAISPDTAQGGALSEVTLRSPDEESEEGDHGR